MLCVLPPPLLRDNEPSEHLWSRRQNSRATKIPPRWLPRSRRQRVLPMDTPITTTEVEKRGRSLSAGDAAAVDAASTNAFGSSATTESTKDADGVRRVAEFRNGPVVPTALTVPVAVMSMAPACAVRYWQCSPVVTSKAGRSDRLARRSGVAHLGRQTHNGPRPERYGTYRGDRRVSCRYTFGHAARDEDRTDGVAESGSGR